MFKVQMKVALADTSGYYVTKWDEAENVTILAENIAEAKVKAAEFLGEPRIGRYWAYKIVQSEELPSDPIEHEKLLTEFCEHLSSRCDLSVSNEVAVFLRQRGE